ncbi:MAG: four helix bundle protein [Cryomorphaceae bacterium]|nr:four helix bundle protein [Cryomorphaceae bacterium]
MKNVIVEKTFNFSVRIMALTKHLRDHEREFDLSRQLFKSATSVGANVNEAQSAASKRDFINKINIALKEANETKYWLELVKSSHIKTDNTIAELISEVSEIRNILTRIILSAKENMKT